MKILGLGTDIIEIARVEKSLARNPEGFLRLVFTQREAAYCSAKKKRGQHLAGRWAAKEAVLKAIGTGWIAGIAWTDIEVVLDSFGKPSVELSGGAKQRADSLGISEILMTISHCDCHATATAIAVGPETGASISPE